MSDLSTCSGLLRTGLRTNVHTGNGFRIIMQKRSYCVIICHSCGSDFMLPPPRNLINAHYEKQRFCS